MPKLAIAAVALAALAVTASAEFAPKSSGATFEIDVLSRTGDNLGKDPAGPLCGICEQLMDQALQQLLNIILQAGVLGSCAAICSKLPVQWESVACNLICDAAGVDAFVHLIQKADLDPIFYCKELTMCKEFEGAAGSVDSVTVTPPSGQSFAFTASITITNTTGAGEVALQFTDSSGAFQGGGASPVGGAEPGSYQMELDFDNETEEGEVLEPGEYTATFYLCQGECGSNHPISKILGEASTTFTIAESKKPTKIVLPSVQVA